MSFQLPDPEVLFSRNQFSSLLGTQVLKQVSEFQLNTIDCLFLLLVDPQGNFIAN